MITADHKVLNEEQESRRHHRYAAVVSDLATQWIQSYPWKKSSQETQISLSKFCTSRRKPKIHSNGQFSDICQSLRRAELESRGINATQIRNTWNCRPSCTTSERERNFVSASSVWTARKMVGGSHGVLLQSPKCARRAC